MTDSGRVDFDVLAQRIKPDDFAQALGAERVGSNWRCPFPDHEDRNPSFSAWRTNGRTMAKCHGCDRSGSPVQIAAELWSMDAPEAARELAERAGLKQLLEASTDGKGGGAGASDDSGLVAAESAESAERPEETQENGGSKGRLSAGLTVSEYAEAKRLPESWLRAEVGAQQIYLDGTPAVRFPYYTRDQMEAASRFRLAMTGGSRFRWKSGTKPVPYGLWRLGEAEEASYVTIVEGESDAQTLWLHDEPALGIPGASTWQQEWAGYLQDISEIYVVVEPDTGGEAVREWLDDADFRERTELVELEDDVSALYLSDSDGFEQAWAEAKQSATPWWEVKERERREEAEEEYERAAELLKSPNLVEKVSEAMTARGYAGDTRPALLAYVAMTSRLLERPVNLAYVATSAAGKNRTVNAAVDLMPEEAYYQLSASSERVLVYNDESFQHRVVVLTEADSLPNNGPAAAAVRSIIEDGRMAYEVVEKDPQTNQFETRRIEKEGPTGLITTSTSSLDRQYGTRTLEVPIPDDDEQTHAVKRAHARSVAGGGDGGQLPDGGIEAFRAVQRWLALAGATDVLIPYAEPLADLTPSNVGMRRWFRLFLTMIQAVALLFQEQRERSEDGAVVATLEDYGVARELLKLVFASTAREGVTDAIRETVEAIEPGERVSQRELADRLDLSEQAVHYRVERGIETGVLVNEASHAGYANQIARGVPLPTDEDALPEVEKLETAWLSEDDEASYESSTRNDEADNGLRDSDVEGGVKALTSETDEGQPPPPDAHADTDDEDEPPRPIPID